MTKEQLEFVAVLAQEFPETKAHIIAELSGRLMKIARKAERNAENLCNIADYADQRDSIKEAIIKLKKEYADFLRNGFQAFGFSLEGDPRGYCLKLFLSKTEKFNTWGGKEEGYGVPC